MNAGVDTFAEVSLLDWALYRRVSSGRQRIESRKIVGVNGLSINTLGVAIIDVSIGKGEVKQLNVVLVKGLSQSVGVQLLLGLDAHEAFQEGGGLFLRFDPMGNEIRYGARVVGAATESTKEDWKEDGDGFYSRKKDGSYVFHWRWRDGIPGAKFPIWNGREMYSSKLGDKKNAEALDSELENWKSQGFLIPYDTSMGPIGAILPINPVIQAGKSTPVRPTLDYKLLNKHIVGTSDRFSNEICTETVRRWRKYPALLTADLSKAYMRISIAPELYRFQVIRWRDQWWALTRLGFGLISAPRAMKVILDEILVNTGVDFFRDDLCVGVENVEDMSGPRAVLQQAIDKLQKNGFPSKPVLELVPGGQEADVLGLTLFSKGNELWWKRKKLKLLEKVETLRHVGADLGSLGAAHLPIQSWLRPMVLLLRSMLGREVDSNWDRLASPELVKLLYELRSKVEEMDPATGRWCITPGYHTHGKGRWFTLCSDASQVAMGAVVVAGTDLSRDNWIEDCAWLNDKPRQINVLETEAVLKGLGVLLKYTTPEDHVVIVTDSKTAASWIQKALNGEILRCKSMSNILLLRRLTVIEELCKELKSVTIKVVPTDQNPADMLTRVPTNWLPVWKGAAWEEKKLAKPEQESVVVAAVSSKFVQWQRPFHEKLENLGELVEGVFCLEHGSRKGLYLPMVMNEYLKEFLEDRHQTLGHPGIAATYAAVREEASFPEGGLAKAVKEIVDACSVCKRKQNIGEYAGSGGSTWGRYPTDELFLDCLTLPSTVGRNGESLKGIILGVDGYSRFGEAEAVPTFDSKEVIAFLEKFINRYGNPNVLRTDRGKEFANQAVAEWAKAKGIQVQFSSVANPRSQAIVERTNQTILLILRVLQEAERRPWIEILPKVMGIYNSRPHKGISMYTPREVFFGRPGASRGGIRMPEQEDQRMIEMLDQLEKEPLPPVGEEEWLPKFEVGQEVLVRKQTPKDMFPWESSRIVEVGRARTYVVENEKGRMKPVHEHLIAPDVEAMEHIGGEESALEMSSDDWEQDGTFGTPRGSEDQLIMEEQRTDGQDVQEVSENREVPSEETGHVNLSNDRIAESSIKNLENEFLENGDNSPRRSKRTKKPVVRFDL